MVSGAAADPFAEEKAAAAAAAAASAMQVPEDEEPADAWDASESSDDDESTTWGSRAAGKHGSNATAVSAPAPKKGAAKGLWAAKAAPPPPPPSKLPTPEPEPETALEPEPEPELLRILRQGGPAAGAEEDAVTHYLNALRRGETAETASTARAHSESGSKKKHKKGTESAFEMAALDGGLGVTLLRLLFLAQDNSPSGVLAWFKNASHTALLQRLCPSPADQSMLWNWCASRLDELPSTLSWVGDKSPHAASKLLLLLYNADVLEVRDAHSDTLHQNHFERDFVCDTRCCAFVGGRCASMG